MTNMTPQAETIGERREIQIIELIKRYNGRWINNNFDFWICSKKEFEEVKEKMEQNK